MFCTVFDRVQDSQDLGAAYLELFPQSVATGFDSALAGQGR